MSLLSVICVNIGIGKYYFIIEAIVPIANDFFRFTSFQLFMVTFPFVLIQPWMENIFHYG